MVFFDSLKSQPQPADKTLHVLLKKSGRSNLFSVARSATIVYNPF